MKINDLMTRLISIQKDYGNVPVVLSTDSEGNSFGTTDKQISVCPIMNNEDKVIGVAIFPFEEGYYDSIEAVQADRS